MPTRAIGLNFYVASPTLRLGAVATYNATADVVEAAVYVRDGDVDHSSELINGSATLLHNEHELATVTFTSAHVTSEGSVKLWFLHPPHVTALTLRATATITGVGSKTTDVAVNDVTVNLAPLTDSAQRQDRFGPRTEANTFDEMTHQLAAAPEEKTTVATDVDRTILMIDLAQQYDYLPVGDGAPAYIGGGSRLLPQLDSSDLALQSVNTLPATLGLRTVIEPAATNLVLNSGFSAMTGQLPTGVTMTLPPSIRVRSQEMLTLTGTVRTLHLGLIGSGAYAGPAIARLTGTPVMINRSLPLSFSVLSRATVNRGTVEDLRLVIDWLSGAGATISSTHIDYDPTELSATSQLALSVTSSSIPVTAVAARWAIELQSVDGGDSIDVYVACPQIEQNAIATSPITTTTTPVTRQADVLSIQQSGNMLPDVGTVLVTFAPAYDGVPPASVTIFDSRDAAKRNGFRAEHGPDGLVTWTAIGADGTTQSISASGVSLSSGETVELSFSWSAQRLAIFKDGVQLAEEQLTLPTITPEAAASMYFLSTCDGAAQLCGELQAVEVWREIQ